MRICFVYQADYPWDVRVEKIADTLTRAGHQVWLVSANESGRSPTEKRAEANVVRLPHVGGRLAWLNRITNFPFFLNPLWIQAIARCVRSSRADLILVRDLPLAIAGILVGRRYRVPVVMDMAECYPELLRSMWRFGKFRLVNVLARNPYLGDIVERFAIKRLSHIFTMVEESRDRLLAKGVEADRLSIVSNTPPVDKFRTLLTARREAAEPGDDALELVYAGWLNRGRGLDTVVEGLGRYVGEYGRDVHLTIIGTGDAHAECRARVNQLGLNDVVTFKGWLDNSEVVAQVMRSHVGLVPHHVCGHWDNTVPNKLFDYMAAGLVVVTSSTRPVARIVTETGCGVVYEDYSPDDFKTQLQKLRDPRVRTEMGERGRRAVIERFNWDTDAKVLLGVIERCRS